MTEISDINKPVKSRRGRQRGYVLIMMGSMAVALLGAVGLAIDMGRLFIAKNETQAYVDAAALGAALELDGSTAGITRAQAAVTNSGNSWNMNSQTVSGATVTFGTSSSGPWASNPSPATGYSYARVQLSVPAKLFFMPAVVNRYTQPVISRATAGQVPITTFKKGLSPYTAVSTNPTGPNFGFTVGDEITIQWPPPNGGPGCSATNPDKCFVKPACDNDANASKWAMYQYWSSSNNGYWGFSANSEIRSSILDGLQTRDIWVGMNIQPYLTNGNKAAQADYLDERAGQDVWSGTSTVPDYMAHADHNGRRLMVVPVVNPVSATESIVLGFAQVLLYANGSSNYYDHESVGNDPFCAIYAGPFTLGSNDKGGAASGSGAYRVKLVE